MADQHRYPLARGDEAELFRAYNDELMRTLSGNIRASTPQVIEDACAFAWAKFLQCQPDRDQNWRGWLFRTAQREAWQLEARQREHRSIGDEAWEQDRTFANARLPRHDPFATQLDVADAFDVLDHLPERLRRVALLRALGMRHKDIGELTGDSPVRVGQLISRANMHVRAICSFRRPLLPGRSPGTVQKATWRAPPCR